MKHPTKLVKDMMGKNNIKLCNKCGRYDSDDLRTAAIIAKRHLPKCECK